jgi:hypothetical protein
MFADSSSDMVGSYPLSGGRYSVASQSSRTEGSANCEHESRPIRTSSNGVHQGVISILRQFNEDLASCSVDCDYLHIAARLAKLEAALNEHRQDGTNAVEILVLTAEIQR